MFSTVGEVKENFFDGRIGYTFKVDRHIHHLYEILVRISLKGEMIFR